MGAKSWNQVEAEFLAAMSAFDATISSTAGRQDMTDAEKSSLSADLQNGKGDFFNDLLALLLENCSGIETLYCRNQRRLELGRERRRLRRDHSPSSLVSAGPVLPEAQVARAPTAEG